MSTSIPADARSSATYAATGSEQRTPFGEVNAFIRPSPYRSRAWTSWWNRQRRRQPSIVVAPPRAKPST
jgi:hypothetical protein